MRAKFSAFAVVLLLALAGCNNAPTPAPHTGDDPEALDLRLHLFLTDEDGHSLEEFGLADASISGIRTPDPDTGEERQTEWIDYDRPDPSQPDGHMHWFGTMPFQMEVPGFRNQRIHPQETIAFTFTAEMDLFMGWTLGCGISDAKSGQMLVAPIPGTPSSFTNSTGLNGDDMEIFVLGTVTCLWPAVTG